MKALLSTAPGGPETLVLSETEAPVPGPNDVLVAVESCGVNFPDTLIIRDLYQFKPPRPFSPGSEVSGRIEGYGANVTGFAIGDRVACYSTCGGMAEKYVTTADLCFKISDKMPADVASAFLMTYGTSHHALKDRAKLQAGETLLVLGAAGGVGLAAVDIGKAFGARVIAAVSSEAKAAAARAHGADDVIIYQTIDMGREVSKAFSDKIKALSGGEGADVIFDAVGGQYAEPALRAAAWEGRYLVVGFPAGIPKLPFNLPLLKGCSIVGVFWGSFIERESQRNRANVAELMALYEQGKIKPLVSEHFPLARGGEAIARLADRAAIGKIVVTI